MSTRKTKKEARFRDQEKKVGREERTSNSFVSITRNRLHTSTYKDTIAAFQHLFPQLGNEFQLQMNKENTKFDGFYASLHNVPLVHNKKSGVHFYVNGTLAKKRHIVAGSDEEMDEVSITTEPKVITTKKNRLGDSGFFEPGLEAGSRRNFAPTVDMRKKFYSFRRGGVNSSILQFSSSVTAKRWRNGKLVNNAN